MADGAAQEGAKYRAFISYSHKDVTFGRRLHRRLESYRLPQRLVGTKAANGIVPRRLAPIFRDIDELPAASDLSVEVREALNASACLIVVCSPAAASSKWVAREIAAFRALHPDRPILAAIADGAPAECFPAGLCGTGPDGERVESLAADFRAGRDGAGLALLKLVAGITGVGLDELVQRDAQRRTRRVMAVTAAALSAVVVMGGLTAFALNARFEAERQRKEAEGLVEYMLTDLRDRLKGVGRLDVMTAVNERALSYYSDQDLNHLSADSLERRARILHAMGEDDETRGNHEAALKKFREAARTTFALLAQSPNDPERIFDQAQSEYWLGYVDYQRGRYAAAKPAFLRYKAFADEMLMLDNKNSKYHREAGYAETNLCAIALKERPKDTAGAIFHCRKGIGETEQAARQSGSESGIADELAELHGWLADAYFASADYAHARAERLDQERILDRELSADPNNMAQKEAWVALQIALSLLDEKAHRVDDARTRLSRADIALTEMIAHEPANREWSAQESWLRTKLSRMH